MYEKLENCPSCKHTHFNNFMICKDYLVSEESFALVKCSSCQLVFVNPRPTNERQKDYSITDANSLSLLKRILNNSLSQRKQKLLKRIVSKYSDPSGSLLILDSKTQANSYQKKFDQITKLQFSDLESIPKKKKFTDLILGQSLIRSHDLRKNIKLIRKLTHDQGRIYLQLDNYQCHDAIHYKDHWSGYDVPRKLYYFNKHSIHKFIKSNKLIVLDEVPNPTQTFLTTLKSEQLDKKPSNRRPFQMARRSNKLADENKSQYSSHIYVLSR